MTNNIKKHYFPIQSNTEASVRGVVRRTGKTSERDIERHLVSRAKAAGGQAMKWVSPGQAGVPDRIVLLPMGRLVFVELKAPGCKPTALQVRVMDRLRSLGFDVLVLDSKEAVDALFSA